MPIAYDTALPEEAREVWKDAKPRCLFCYSLILPQTRPDLNSFLPILPAPKQTRQAMDPGSSAQGWCCFLPVCLEAHSGDMSRCLADVQPYSHQPTIIHCRDYARGEGGGWLPSLEDSHRKYHLCPSRVERREDIHVWLHVLRLYGIVCTVPGYWSGALCGPVCYLSHGSSAQKACRS